MGELIEIDNEALKMEKLNDFFKDVLSKGGVSKDFINELSDNVFDKCGKDYTIDDVYDFIRDIELTVLKDGSDKLDIFINANNYNYDVNIYNEILKDIEKSLFDTGERIGIKVSRRMLGLSSAQQKNILLENFIKDKFSKIPLSERINIFCEEKIELTRVQSFLNLADVNVEYDEVKKIYTVDLIFPSNFFYYIFENKSTGEILRRLYILLNDNSNFNYELLNEGYQHKKYLDSIYPNEEYSHYALQEEYSYILQEIMVAVSLANQNIETSIYFGCPPKVKN